MKEMGIIHKSFLQMSKNTTFHIKANNNNGQWQDDYFEIKYCQKKTWIGGFSNITFKGATGDPQNLIYSESLPQCGT